MESCVRMEPPHGGQWRRGSGGGGGGWVCPGFRLVGRRIFR